MKNIVLSVVAALAMSSFAVAGGNIAPVEVAETPIIIEEDNGAFYLGLGYGVFNEEVEVDSVSYDEAFDMGTVMFQVGYKFNDYIAVEGRYWLGIDDLEGDNDTLTGDFSSWGIYVKPMYPVTEAFDVYALLGYASTTLDFDDNQKLLYLDTDSFSWGIGAEYTFTENLSLFVDYTVLGYTDEFTLNGIDLPTDEVDVTIDTINFGVTYTF